MSEPTTPDENAQSTEHAEDAAAVEEEYAEGETSDPEGAERPAPAGEDYAGSGF